MEGVDQTFVLLCLSLFLVFLKPPCGAMSGFQVECSAGKPQSCRLRRVQPLCHAAIISEHAPVMGSVGVSVGGCIVHCGPTLETCYSSCH